MLRERYKPVPAHWSEARDGADGLTPAQTLAAIRDFTTWLSYWPRGLPCKISFSQWVAMVQRGGGLPPADDDPLMSELTLDIEHKMRLWLMMFIIATLGLYHLWLDAPTGRMSPDDRMRRAGYLRKKQDDGALLTILSAGPTPLTTGAAAGGIEAVRTAYLDEHQDVEASLASVRAAEFDSLGQR